MAAALAQPSSATYCLHDATGPFRRAVADWAQRRFGVAVDPESEVLLLVGSQEGTAHLPLAVLNPGESALLLDPYYPSHLGGLQLASAVPLRLPLQSEAGWRPDFGRLPSSQWDQLKLMVLGFPTTPPPRWAARSGWMRRRTWLRVTTSSSPTTIPTWI